MNKALAKTMTAAFLTTCLTAAAYNQPTPEEPLVIWESEEGHDLSEWNLMAIKKSGNFLDFISETPSAKYNYYIQCLTKDNNGNYVTPGHLQIGTNFGDWNEDSYTQTGERDWFNTLLDWSTAYHDVLITNQIAYNLRRPRNLQINGESGTIHKVQIIAVPVYDEKTVFEFTGSVDGKADIKVDGNTDSSSYEFWNSGNNEYILSVSGDYIKELGLAAGDRLGFRFNYGQDGSYANVYYGTSAEGDPFSTIQVPKSGMTRFFEITADNLTKIEKSGLSVKGQWINIDSILKASQFKDDAEENGDDSTAGDSDRELVDLFVPGVYPKDLNWDKDFFGRYYDGVLRDDLKHFGIGVINENEPSLPYGRKTHPVYSFFDEWWSAADYGTNSKNSRERILAAIYDNEQRDSWPLQLSGTMIPNISRIQLGDKILINITARGLGSDGYSAQAQLGTFDPEHFDPEDPNAGHYSITAFDDGYGNPLDWHNFENGTHTVEFIVDPVLLQYITRYGLTINGRFFDINWVKAEVAKKSDEKTDNTEAEYYYNVVKKVGGSFAETGLLELTFPDDKKYNETITHYYSDESKTQWINSVTETHEPRDLDDSNNDAFHVAVRYMNGDRWERIHVESTLTAECFYNGDEPAYMPEKANGPDRTAEDTSVTYIDGIKGYTVVRNHEATNQNRKTMVLYVESGNIRNSIAANGIQVRGKKYDVDLVDDDVFTYADEITDDNDAPTEIYTLSGMRVSETAPGNMYIVKKGNTSKKMKF